VRLQETCNIVVMIIWSVCELTLLVCYAGLSLYQSCTRLSPSQAGFPTQQVLDLLPPKSICIGHLADTSSPFYRFFYSSCFTSWHCTGFIPTLKSQLQFAGFRSRGLQSYCMAFLYLVSLVAMKMSSYSCQKKTSNILSLCINIFTCLSCTFSSHAV
jgi:hypothetical protein